MTRRILSVWLPGWPIRRLVREGWPADQPLVTVETLQGQRRIAAASPSAERLGITHGQSLAQARALCATLTVCEANREADQAGLARLAAWCEHLSPLAAPDAPDGLWIDITGCAHLVGGEQALADALARRLAPCRIAIAATAGAAWALARASTRKPVEVITSGTERQALDRLGVGLLRLDDRTVASLRRIGLRSIGELSRQPRPDITARFGPLVAQRLDQAFGIIADAIAWPHAPAPWSERLAFAEPIGTQDDIEHALKLLAEALCKRLEAAGLGGLRFAAIFFRVDNIRPIIEIAMAKPLRTASRIAKLLGTKIEAIDPGFGIEAVALDAVETAPLALTQGTIGGTLQSLAMGARNEAEEDLSSVIDDLANHLSPEQIWRPAPQASHVPERATTIASPLSDVAAFPAPSGERPIRLLRPPEAISAIAQIPDDPPVQFRWRNAVHRVRAASGPERIAAEWWRRSETNERFRDYYRIEDQGGARFWLFRTSAAGEAPTLEWFVHGFFG